ncbi:type III pantothenate kinase [bacterium]|nr:type III pantothenate kinase [bacterium]
MSASPLLVLDIGNTHVVLGIYNRSDGKTWADPDSDPPPELKIRRRLATHSGRTADEAWILVKMLCIDAGIDPSDIREVAIAGVAPKIGMVYTELSRQHLGVEPFIIHGEAPGFVNLYRNPRAVGADRVCDAVAGFEKYGGPLLILDFGTAVTIDVIGREGEYMGGIILPGLHTAVDALRRAAALLPAVELSMPDKVIGRTTDESIRTGIMRGTVEALKGLIREVKAELNAPDAGVISTGGMARDVIPFLPEVIAHEPDLVLEGIRILYRRHLARQSEAG